MLIAALVLLAAMAASASVVAARWADEAQREREQELLRIGNEIAGALAAYAKDSAGSTYSRPRELEALLEDRRAFGIKRYLRRIEPDPMTGQPAWGVIRAEDGGIAGVFSHGEKRPFLRVPRALSHVDLPVVDRYADWKFTPRQVTKS
ncbi:type II secretion system protein [Roseateles asaccharophilus]|uniref:Type II secretion system protein n=1 Tax=Roseateles asaccharophilus TaxID=582607 RepID=A0ABU2ADY3_9BURK|nr:type II secretion system protein [Roseateles asaccharophilus]MDR7335399.1 hypothetical protein [Roseateles asaccharophilus]